MIGEGLVFEELKIFTKNPKKYESIYTDFGWMELCKNGMPIMYVNVWDCSARLIYYGKDITNLFPKFQDWVGKSEIRITQSGIYPPLRVIADAVEEEIEKGNLPEPNSFKTKEEYENWKLDSIKLQEAYKK